MSTARDRLRKRLNRGLAAGAPPGFADLHAFVAAFEDGNAPPAEVTRRLAAAFEAILDGKPADKALRLQRKGRRPPTGRQLAERVGVAFRVELLRRTGATKDAAIEKVAECKRGLDYDRVKKWHETHREDAHRQLRLIDLLTKNERERQQLIEKLLQQAD